VEGVSGKKCDKSKAPFSGNSVKKKNLGSWKEKKVLCKEVAVANNETDINRRGKKLEENPRESRGLQEHSYGNTA